MADRSIQELRRHYLHKLYESSGGNSGRGVNRKQLQSKLGISADDDMAIYNYLFGKGLAEYHSPISVRITVKGIDEVEREMQTNYAEQERRVLLKLYEMGGVHHLDWVLIRDLANELGMEYRVVNDILLELERQKGLIDGREDDVRLNSNGIQVIEGGGQQVGAPVSVTYQTNIHGPNYGGIQQGGQGNTQNVTLTNNPDFDKAITSLVELIRSSSIPEDDKEEIQNELQSVNKLALKEKSPSTLERAKLKLDYIKTGLAGTEIAIKAAPYLTALYHFFQSL